MSYTVVMKKLGIIMAEENIDNLTMEQYLTLTRGNQAPGVELREDAFSSYKNDDAYEHIERVLDIVSLFNIPRVTRDAVMLHVFPITLTGAVKRPIPGMMPTKGLTIIQIMADHSQKWHDGSSSQSVCSSNNSKGMAAILCDGPRLDKECPLNEDAKSVGEVKYGEGRSSPFNGKKYRVGPPGYYTRVKNRPPFGEKSWKCKAVYDDALINKASSNKANKIHRVSFIDKKEYDNLPSEGLPCQLPPKEINPGSFTLPCTIGSLDFYAMVDLGASINVMPKSMFEHLKLANLKETNMLVEMANMTKKAPLGIIESILVKIDKFLFSSDFMIIDMLKTSNETMILGRPFLATIHAEIDIFNKEISLGIGDDIIILDMNKKSYEFTTPIEKAYMGNVVHGKDLIDIDSISRVNEGVREYGASYNPYKNKFNGEYLPDSDIKRYWEITNDDERINFTWENLSLNDWMKIRYGKIFKSTRGRILKDHWKEKFSKEDDDTDEGWEDPKKCGEEK
ncbi:hypothetical protein Tco_1000700 [Tanacetum coccineum]